MKTPFNFRDSSGHLVALALALGIVLPLPSSAASLRRQRIRLLTSITLPYSATPPKPAITRSSSDS